MLASHLVPYDRFRRGPSVRSRWPMVPPICRVHSPAEFGAEVWNTAHSDGLTLPFQLTFRIRCAECGQMLSLAMVNFGKAMA